MFEFKLPDLGEGVHEGEIVKWYVQVGAVIQEDDSLVDVETDKAAVTIPSPVGGTVVRLGGEVGDTVMVGEVMAVIEQAEAVAPAPVEPEPEAPTAEAPAPALRIPPAAPATRRLARELRVDLKLVAPTGPGGRITPEDVKGFAEKRAAAPAPLPREVAPAVPPPSEEVATAH